MDQNLLAQLDSEGRTALDWGMEKIYFMKEEAKGAGLDGRGAAMVSQAKSCVLHGLNWILAQKFEAPWCGSGRRFLQLALSCGELEIALLAGRAGAEAGPDVWLCGLAAPWNAPLMAKAYLAELASRFGLEGDSVAFGLPLGLHAAQLWCAGAIDDDALLLLHEAGVRADQETEDASLESLYAASAKSGTDKLDQILVKLGL